MNLTMFVDKANRLFFRLIDPDTGQIVVDNAAPIDDKTAFEVSAGTGGGATPTLAAVLAEGNDPEETAIEAATVGATSGGKFQVVPGDGEYGGSVVLTGGAAAGADKFAGDVVITGGVGSAGADSGGLIVSVGGSTGTAGQVLGSVTSLDTSQKVGWVDPAAGAAEIVITEDASGAAGTYSGSIVVPGGATMTGLYSTLLANWSFNAAVVISIGDGRGADAFVQDQPGSWDVGTTVNHLGLALSAFGGSGVGVAHKYDALYSDTDHEILISVVVSDTNPPGTGIFRVLVTWSLPPSSAGTFEAAP